MSMSRFIICCIDVFVPMNGFMSGQLTFLSETILANVNSNNVVGFLFYVLTSQLNVCTADTASSHESHLCLIKMTKPITEEDMWESWTEGKQGHHIVVSDSPPLLALCQLIDLGFWRGLGWSTYCHHQGRERPGSRGPLGKPPSLICRGDSQN